MHKKNLLKAALAALLAVHLAKTVARNVDWRDELSIFKVFINTVSYLFTIVALCNYP